MANTGPKRNKLRRQSDREAVARLSLQGWSQSDIAQFLEIDQSTVSRDLKAVQEQWKQSAIRDFDLDRQQELERLRLAEKEFWQAWERSQGERETSINERFLTGKDENGNPVGRVKVGTRTEQKPGDCQFLSGVVKCVELRSKLLGLFPSDKTTGSGAIAFTDNQVSVLASLMKEASDD